MTSTRGLPLAVRKELLLTRAALERAEFEQSMSDLRHAGGRLAGFSRLFGAGAGARGPLAGAALSALSVLREYPYLGSVASLAFGAARGTRVGRWLMRLSLLGGLVAGGAMLLARRNDVPRD